MKGSGKIAGIIWQFANGNHECLIQIDRSSPWVNVVIFDSELVTANFESIANGVFWECLAELYQPEVINFFHKTTLPENIIAQQGIRSVNMEWSIENKEFLKPSWGKWIPDFELNKEEVDFSFSMVLGARVGLDKVIEKEVSLNGPLEQKKLAIYNDYKAQIIALENRSYFHLHTFKN